MDWRTSDSKFGDPDRPESPGRASAARIGRMLADVPGSNALLDQWVRRLVFSIMLGDNDAHAKNIALLHTRQGTALAPAYDTVPNLFQRDMVAEGFRLAIAVDGTFDHREISAERLVAEVRSWKVTTAARATALVESAVAACADAVDRAPRPEGLSDGLADKIDWTAERLVSGAAISTSPWQDGVRPMRSDRVRLHPSVTPVD